MTSHHGIPLVEGLSVGFEGEKGVGIGGKRGASFTMFKKERAFQSCRYGLRGLFSLNIPGERIVSSLEVLLVLVLICHIEGGRAELTIKF